MQISCPKEGCTVAQTGICLLNHDPATDCPESNRTVLANTEQQAGPPLSLRTSDLTIEASSLEQLSASLTMNLEQVAQLMTSRYCHIIGIVGSPDAGKTASLVSLYLLLSTGKLRSFQFADSRSLMALDEISRGTRRWNSGVPPEQMTGHTMQPDARSAGLLHVRLRFAETGEPVDFFLPDLPGEWSASLVDSNRVDRFEFLKAAECIWVMVDGDQLRDQTSRKDAIHRTNMLIRRLCEFLEDYHPKFILVVTRRDGGEVPFSAIEAIKNATSLHGKEIEVVEIASFSENPTIPAGFGIDELIKRSVTTNDRQRTFWPESDRKSDSRRMLQYRHQGNFE